MAELYNWENDEDLTTNKSSIDFPLSENLKVRKTFEALEQGYHYSDKNLLYKMVKVKINKENIKYNPSDLKIDEKGRKYYFDEYGTINYLDDLGYIYGIRYKEELEMLAKMIKEMLVIFVIRQIPLMSLILILRKK